MAHKTNGLAYESQTHLLQVTMTMTQYFALVFSMQDGADTTLWHLKLSEVCHVVL